MPSLFEHAGGEEALHRLEEAFYRSVLSDPVLKPLFGEGRPEHVDHLAALDAVELPDDPPFREAVRAHVELGSRVAMQNSHATTDDELHPVAGGSPLEVGGRRVTMVSRDRGVDAGNLYMSSSNRIVPLAECAPTRRGSSTRSTAPTSVSRSPETAGRWPS